MFLITADNDNELSHIVQRLAIHAELHQSCRVWRDKTFVALQQLAGRLAKGDTRRLLTELKRAIDMRASDPQGSEEAFGRAYTGALLQYKQVVYSTNKPVGDSKILVVGVKDALNAVNGQWRAITADLDALHARVSTKLGTSDPDIRELYVDFGLDSWATLETAAQRFVADVPAQQKNLNGNYHYDQIPVQEERRYVLQNYGGNVPRLTGFHLVLDTSTIARDTADPLYKPDWTQVHEVVQGVELARQNGLKDDMVRLRLGYRPHEPALSSAASDTRKEWYFVKRGAGWWNIVSADRGSSEVLDVIDNGGSVTDRQDPARLYIPVMRKRAEAIPRGQLWRMVPQRGLSLDGIPDFMHVRIYNAFLGEGRALEYRETFQGHGMGGSRLTGRVPINTCVMGLRENSSFQDWDILSDYTLIY